MKSEDDERVGRRPFDRILAAAGLTDMDVCEAAFMVMTMAARDLDDDIRLIMAEINAMTNAKQRLRALIADLNQWISQEMSRTADDEAGRQPVAGSSPRGMFKVSSQGVEYDRPRPDLEAPNLVAEHRATYDLGGRVTTVGLASLLDELKGKLDGMSEMSEETALRLQLTMDRRAKLISTLSNMMKKISTTQDTLVQNIK